MHAPHRPLPHPAAIRPRPLADPGTRATARGAVHRPVDTAAETVASRGPGRRALLGTGLTALAAAGAAIGLGAHRSDADVLPDQITYGPAPSGADDTAALQAALPTAGVLN